MKKMIVLAFPLLFVLVAFHPNDGFVISGKITDDTGGVSVLVKSTKNGILTDASGSLAYCQLLMVYSTGCTNFYLTKKTQP
jgi:hypothetical protein